MSASANVSSFMLNVGLNELNEPYKLAKWIQILPKYRKYYLNMHDNGNNIKVDHNANCQLLSEFMYQTQYSGQHMVYNFNEIDFKQLLDVIHDTNNKYNYNDYIWIWKIIKHAQNIKQNQSNPELPWIESEWKRFEIMEHKFIQKNEEIKEFQTEIIAPINDARIMDSMENKNNTKFGYGNSITELSKHELEQSVSGDSDDQFDENINDQEAALLAKSQDQIVRVYTESVDIGDDGNSMNIPFLSVPTEENDNDNKSNAGRLTTQRSTRNTTDQTASELCTCIIL